MISRPLQVAIPKLVRIKPGALDRLGIYAKRLMARRAAVLLSRGLPPILSERADTALRDAGLLIDAWLEIDDASFEKSQQVFAELPGSVDLVVGLGGGKALDVAKHVAFLARRPYVAVPTSLSNDGFSSPQSSLTLKGQRRSLPAAMPLGVVIDTDVCVAAPHALFCSGVGDLAAKLTAVADWKLAFHARGEPVDDFAALLSDATVFQFMACPTRDAEGMRLLGTALMLNGIAMEICGSSRPASGSEHLISHALDTVSPKPRLHGLQVGVATYLVSLLQHRAVDSKPAKPGGPIPMGPSIPERLAELFGNTGLLKLVAEQPFSRKEWQEAIRCAPRIKHDFYTILSVGDPETEILELTHEDRVIAPCFSD